MVSLKDIVDCYIPREGVEVRTTKCPKYGSWTVEIRNEYGLCFRKSDYEPDWQYDLEQALAVYCYTISQAMEALKAEPANYLREIASRQKDSQQMITKRIIGRWLHKRGLKVVAREPNAYTMTGSKGRINFWICQNGFVGAQMFSTVCAVVDHSNDIAGFTNLVKQLGEQ